MTVSPAKMAELIEMPFRIWTLVVQRICVLDGVQIPWQWALLRGWCWDFPTRWQVPFPVALTSGFRCMLSTIIPIGRPQKQSSVALSFPSEKFSAMWSLVKIFWPFVNYNYYYCNMLLCLRFGFCWPLCTFINYIKKLSYTLCPKKKMEPLYFCV